VGLGEAIWAVRVPMVRLQVMRTGAGKRVPDRGRIEAAPPRDRRLETLADQLLNRSRRLGLLMIDFESAERLAS